MTDAWPYQAYLDALRPEPGWAVETAILASYSADISSIGAALLALAGRDDDGGSGGPSDLAEAVEELRGRVRIVIQRGRIARLKRLPLVAGIFDQFLAEVPFDETEHSWHPKVALVCFSNPEGGKSWRFWMGSRNLTSAENLDFGLLLSSAQGLRTIGDKIEGLDLLAERLAELAKLPKVIPANFAKEIGPVRWISPVGFKVHNICLTSGQGDGTFPTPPDRIVEVIVISPFLDGKFVGALGRWGNDQTRRAILSTHSELQKLAGQSGRPLKGFSDRILAFEAPIADEVDLDSSKPEAEPEETSLEPGAEQPAHFGLHAKILAARSARKLWLWIGSANATNRAWTANNVEVIAEIEADPRCLIGLNHLLGQGRPITEEALAREPVIRVDEIRERLGEARKYVAAHSLGILSRCGEAFALVVDTPPHPPDSSILLEAGLATGALIVWPRKTTKLDLGLQPVSLQTELVQFRLSLEGHECGWIQRYIASPPLDETRDRSALARHLGPKAFLEWLRSLLQGGIGGEDGDVPWDSPEGQRERSRATDAKLDFLTLEDMLLCWARDPKAFERTDERLQSYLDLIIAEDNTLNTKDLTQLQELKTIWNTLTSELLEQS